MSLVMQNTTKNQLSGSVRKLTLTTNNNHAVLNKAEAIPDARNKIDTFHRYVPHNTHSISQQNILIERISSKSPTELRYIERSLFMKVVYNQKLWTFELRVQQSLKVPIWITVGFQQRKRQDSKNLKSDTVCRLPVTSAQCIIGTENYPDPCLK